jgi:hypothetical protein
MCRLLVGCQSSRQKNLIQEIYGLFQREESGGIGKDREGSGKIEHNRIKSKQIGKNRNSLVAHSAQTTVYAEPARQ